jgi:subtilisin-like proprotein convertase family protein
MSLSAWPGSSQTIQCRAYASHPLGTGCAGNTDSDGVINVRVGGDDAGGQFTIDVVEAQLSADYQSHDTRLPIADNSNPGAVSTISISDSETVEIVEVFLQIEHGYTEDLEVELEAPNGQRVMLANHVSDVELEQTLYSDLDVMANAERSDYGSQILRAYRPDGLLYNLKGIDKAGNWRLHVTDSVYSNRSDAMGGTLLGWGLRFRRLADYLRN